MPTTTLVEAIDRTVIDVTERFNKGGVDYVGIPSGFHKIDEVTSGFRKKATYVLAARSGMGKTSLGVSMAMNVAAQGHKVLYLSLEMSAELLAMRIMSSTSGIPSEMIEKGKLTAQEHKRVTEIADTLRDLPFVICDDVVTSEYMVDYVKNRQIQEGLDFLVVDYLGLLRDVSSHGDVERLGRISNNINALANECNIPVLSLAQLNRNVEMRENHTPMISDIRSSGDIEQDAAVIFLMTRPHVYEMLYNDQAPLECEDNAQIIIAKNRFGDTGMTRARFYPKQVKWTQPAPELTKPPRVGQNLQEDKKLSEPTITTMTVALHDHPKSATPLADKARRGRGVKPSSV